jgi:hypothetical protein
MILHLFPFPTPCYLSILFSDNEVNCVAISSHHHMQFFTRNTMTICRTRKATIGLVDDDPGKYEITK